MLSRTASKIKIVAKVSPMADEQPRANLTKCKPSMETKNSKTENNILSEADMLTTGWQDYFQISKFKMSVSSSDIFLFQILSSRLDVIENKHIQQKWKIKRRTIYYSRQKKIATFSQVARCDKYPTPQFQGWAERPQTKLKKKWTPQPTFKFGVWG